METDSPEQRKALERVQKDIRTGIRIFTVVGVLIYLGALCLLVTLVWWVSKRLMFQ